jgi:hypothetical protein
MMQNFKFAYLTRTKAAIFDATASVILEAHIVLEHARQIRSKISDWIF